MYLLGMAHEYSMAFWRDAFPRVRQWGFDSFEGLPPEDHDESFISTAARCERRRPSSLTAAPSGRPPEALGSPAPSASRARALRAAGRVAGSD